MIDLTGKDIGRYHIIERLGRGGMASVYKAYDTNLERNVALKVIRAEKVESPETLARFEREARALAQLEHPNIVNIHDYGHEEGMPYVVMSYLPGGTLKERLGEPSHTGKRRACWSPSPAPWTMPTAGISSTAM